MKTRINTRLKVITFFLRELVNSCLTHDPESRIHLKVGNQLEMREYNWFGKLQYILLTQTLEAPITIAVYLRFSQLNPTLP